MRNYSAHSLPGCLIFCAAALLLVLSTRRAPAAVLTLAPSQDTYLSEQSALPSGLSSELVIGTQGTRADLARNRGLIRFDALNQLPPNAVITSVSLSLTVNKVPLGAPDATFDLHRMLRGWDDRQSTWVTRLGTDLWSSPGGAPGLDWAEPASASVNLPTPALYTLGSTPALIADVTAWVSHPESNYGWMIKTSDEDLAMSARRVAAVDGLSGRPGLEVHYELPVANLRIASPGLAANQFCLSFDAQAGITYFVERRTDLGPTGTWVLVTNLPPTTTAGTITVCDPLLTAAHCYRVGQR